MLRSLSPIYIFLLILQLAIPVSFAFASVVVGVLDSGVDPNHPELSDSLWINTKEIPNNNIDDDQNGYVDDYYGWDFVEDKPLYKDPNGHGTHIAGIIAAKGVHPQLNKGLGYGSKIMGVRYFAKDQSGQRNLECSIKAFRYALDNGADLINYSGGGPLPNGAERAVLQLAEKKNVIVVAAAGNSGHNLNSDGFYPATYSLSNIISVAANGLDGTLIKPSNYGQNKVELSALGLKVFSTLPKGNYGTMTGTSQATAQVTAYLAHLMNSEPELKRSPEAIRQRLRFVGTRSPALKRKLASESHLEAQRATNIRGLGRDAFGDPIQAFPLLDTVLQSESLGLWAPILVQ